MLLFIYISSFTLFTQPFFFFSQLFILYWGIADHREGNGTPLHLSSIFSCIRIFPNVSALHIRQPKFWSCSFSISPSNEYSGLISFRTNWFDLLAIQRTLKSLLQHHSWKTSVLWCSAFFIVQLSHPYVTMGKMIALTR